MKICAIIIGALGPFVSAGALADAPLQPVTVKSSGLVVTLDGVGKKALGDVKTVVEQQISLVDDKSMTPPLADDMAFFVRQRYLDLGYPEVSVAWDIIGGSAMLHVKEGNYYQVGAISYEGDVTEDKKRLSSYLLRPTHEKLETGGNHPPFVETDLRSGAELVQRFFQGEGYLEAIVDPPVFTAHPESGRKDVLLRVHKGRRYVFGEIQVAGDLGNQSDAVHKKILKLKGPYSAVNVQAAQNDIVGIYQNLGYYAVTTSVTSDPAQHRDDGVVPVAYQVDPGPLYHITSVKISPSLSKGAQRIIQSNIKPAVGRLYIPQDMEVIQKRMMQTDVFARLDMNPTPQANGELALDITGEEARPKRLSFFAGYQTFFGPILGVDYRDYNFHDTGDALHLKAEYALLGPDGSIGWIDPAIFGTPFSLDTELSFQAYMPYNYYDRRTLSLKSTLARQWTKHISSSLFVEASTNQTTSTRLTPEELGPATYTLARLGGALTLDYRDSPVSPTKGWFGSLSAVGSTGGSINYLRTDAVFSYYLPITDKLNLAFGARASSIQVSGGLDALPIDLRLFNGGATSVRSFAELAMGPHSPTEVPLGGTQTEVFNVEATYYVMSNLGIAAFFDAGSISGAPDNSFSPPSGLRYGIGAGIRYKLPIGPLRLDYGINPDPRQGEAHGALFITFGVAF